MAWQALHEGRPGRLPGGLDCGDTGLTVDQGAVQGGRSDRSRAWSPASCGWRDGPVPDVSALCRGHSELWSWPQRSCERPSNAAGAPPIALPGGGAIRPIKGAPMAYPRPPDSRHPDPRSPLEAFRRSRHCPGRPCRPKLTGIGENTPQAATEIDGPGCLPALLRQPPSMMRLTRGLRAFSGAVGVRKTLPIRCGNLGKALAR